MLNSPLRFNDDWGEKQEVSLQCLIKGDRPSKRSFSRLDPLGNA